jgi:FkbM family methyltransferase
VGGGAGDAAGGPDPPNADGKKEIAIPLTTLPNGLSLETSSAREAAFLYSELFERHSYTRHGIEVGNGATVLDIGANVGAFSVALAQQYGGLRLVLFEPIPDTFALLERNAERLLGNARVTLVNAGVSSAPGRVTFRVPPESTMATAYPRSKERAARDAEKGSLETWVRAGLEDFRRARQIRPRVAAAIERALESRMLRPVVLGAILMTVGATSVSARLRTKHVECELTTISRALREYAIDVVDLAKVDVEGAEWEVLQGIDDSDWPRIRQLAIEVHDVDGRVERMRELLTAKGYRVAVEQADWATHRLMGVHMLYASRDGSDQT